VSRDAVTYRVEHQTRYQHPGMVSVSHHLGWLKPRQLPTQAVRSFRLEVEPEPADRVERLDYFGNSLTYFAILSPYRELTVVARSIIDVMAPERAVVPEDSPAWDDPAASQPLAIEEEQFRYGSPYIGTSEQLANYARRSFLPGRPLLSAAIDLMHRIHGDFRYHPGATTVTTPLTRVMSEQRGVCQDFAHVQIGCLRSLGIPARYVSGYLLTEPPPGRPRLIGADASHAWISVRCPLHGWVDLDPTNDLLPDLRHVTVAWGRDYSDISPLRGVVLGGGEHELQVGVSVVPASSETASIR
jgi:transglutaminase-like putative cysteine protease